MSDSRGFQFVDTNILVYAHDTSSGEKHVLAKAIINDLWDTGRGCLSIQVMQEFYVTVTHKVMKPLQAEVAARIISDLSQWKLHLPGAGDILEAIDIQQRNRLSFWDAMIICSAKKLGCKIILTEDMNEGQFYEGIKAHNPLL